MAGKLTLFDNGFGALGVLGPGALVEGYAGGAGDLETEGHDGDRKSTRLNSSHRR